MDIRMNKSSKTQNLSGEGREIERVRWEGGREER